jgi:lysozyme family protein
MTVFKRYYWDRMQADGIRSQSIANLLVDWVWLSGAWGIKNAQKELGVTADGIVGMKTLAAINGFQTEQLLFNRLWRARQAYILRISTGSQKKFRLGWLNRLDAIRYGRLVCNGGKVIRY